MSVAVVDVIDWSVEQASPPNITAPAIIRAQTTFFMRGILLKRGVYKVTHAMPAHAIACKTPGGRKTIVNIAASASMDPDTANASVRRISPAGSGLFDLFFRSISISKQSLIMQLPVVTSRVIAMATTTVGLQNDQSDFDCIHAPASTNDVAVGMF